MSNSAIAGKSIVKTELVTILIPKANGADTSNIFQFPDDQYIRNKRLMFISVYTEDIVPMYTDNKKIVTNDFIKNCYITLESYSGVQFIRNMPLIDFQTMVGSVAAQFQTNNFIGQRVNWPKCTITVANAQNVTSIEDRYLIVNVGFTEIAANMATMIKTLGTGFNKRK